MSLIVKPLITEKNTIHNAGGVYVFEVELAADKAAIKKAIEKSFRVKVDSVNTVVCRGHAKRSKSGISPAPYWKKAMVKLVPGEKIALFEGA